MWIILLVAAFIVAASFLMALLAAATDRDGDDLEQEEYLREWNERRKRK